MKPRDVSAPPLYELIQNTPFFPSRPTFSFSMVLPGLSIGEEKMVPFFILRPCCKGGLPPLTRFTCAPAAAYEMIGRLRLHPASSASYSPHRAPSFSQFLLIFYHEAASRNGGSYWPSPTPPRSTNVSTPLVSLPPPL